jgi:hypothetical protein
VEDAEAMTSIELANENLNSMLAAMRILELTSRAETATEQKIRALAKFKPTKGLDSVKTLSDDPVEFLEWKTTVDTWLTASGFQRIINLGPESIAKSPYLSQRMQNSMCYFTASSHKVCNTKLKQKR